MSSAVLGVTGAVALGVGAASVGAGLYEYEGQKGIESQALSLAQGTQGEQQYDWQQLQNLIANPNSFFSSATYQSAANQGSQAVARQMAAGGFLESGNEATALQQYGQTFGQQQLLSQEQLLASISGVGAASSPASSLNSASSANSASFNQLGTLLAALGQTSAMSGLGGGGFSPSFDTSNTGYSYSLPPPTSPNGLW